jgi:hypothetical protein
MSQIFKSFLKKIMQSVFFTLFRDLQRHRVKSLFGKETPYRR